MLFPQKKFFLALLATTSLFGSTLFSQQAPPAGTQSVISVSDYTEFLNCVAATDTYGVYNPKMGEDAGIGSIITRSGKPGSYTYNDNPEKASFPVTYVSQVSAMRYCNWKSHHGAFGLQDSTTTETGSYDLTAFDQGADIATVILTPGANFFLPTNDLIDTTFQDASTQSCDPYLASSRLGFCIGTWSSTSSSNAASGDSGALNQAGAGGVNGSGSLGNASGSAPTATSKAHDVTLKTTTPSTGISMLRDAVPANSNQINISLVQVGAPNNPADLSSTNSGTTNGYGAVLMPYQIGTYDVKASEYCAFLNAVAKKSDPHGLYNTNMTSDPDVACITRSGDAISGYTYVPIDGRKDFPITYVGWFAATRFCNWLENGQPTGDQTNGVTENGAFVAGVPVQGAAWSLPTEDQWYKAAYYLPSTNNTSGKYCSFGTDSNDAPGNKWEEAVVANRANYSLNGIVTTSTQPRLTPVGSFKSSASPWGAYDMAGEVNQWTSTFDASGNNVIIRGGSWKSQTSAELKSTTRFTNPVLGGSTVGFRVVYNIPPPPRVTHLDMMKDLVPVGDPNNTADTPIAPGVPGFGSVPTVYQIEKYDVTAEQYCMFLNAVATHADPHALYNLKMATDSDVACIIRYGNLNRGYSYFTIPGREKFPITYVNAFATLRFCNWLAHDQPIGYESPETTETGSFNQDDQGAFSIATNNPKWLLPTEDQWYKAAYYQPAKDGSSGFYCSFGTGSYDPPVNSLSTISNSANYCLNSVFTTPTQPRLTAVGTFTKTTSPCGAYDMAGDVSQWTMTTILSDPNSFVVRGGSWQSTSFQGLRFSAALFVDAGSSSSTTGFRVIYNVPPPPPTPTQVATTIFQNVTKTLYTDGKSLVTLHATTQDGSNPFFGYITGPFMGGIYKWVLSGLTLVFRNICLFFQKLLTAILPDGMMKTLSGWFRGFFNFFFKSIGVETEAGADFAEIGLWDSMMTTGGEYTMMATNPPLALAIMLAGILTYAAYEDLQQSDPRAGITFATFDIGYIIGIIRCFL
ncbi:MAG: formylglycine-generating enzyme family protein [Chthoniobacterales bacterium]|nr:formylglycine-generating enzyme family protein [Chthoniobacterales bacterium]